MLITTFTDPNCPWAFSAEAFRLALRWTYGEQLQWRRAYVVIAERIGESEARGFTPQVEAVEDAEIAATWGMPLHLGVRARITTSLRPALAARAARAAREIGDDAEERLLRALWIRGRSHGQMVDEREVLAAAAEDAGVSPSAILGALERPDVERAVRADMRAARAPLLAARQLEHKLGGNGNGRRYTSPTWIFQTPERDPVVAPGFQTLATYEALIANVEPELERRPHPGSAEEVVRWAAHPLSTAEVAGVMRTTREQARAGLAAVARFEPAGSDG